MTENTDEICNCPSCITERLYPPTSDPADRKPVVVGIDVSTKFIAIGIIPAMGSLAETGSLVFAIESKKQNERCTEASWKTASLLEIVDASVDITSVAIESPVGFGGKLLPIVGAVTAACGMNTEWYAPTTWQSIIRKEYPLPDGEKMKDRIHAAIPINIPEFAEVWGGSTEDQKDSICIALAHRIETLNSTDLTEHDMRWLNGESL